MHQPESGQRPQGLADALVRGAPSFEGDQEAHAEERQAVEEIDRRQAQGLQRLSFRLAPAPANDPGVRKSLGLSEPAPAHAAESISRVRAGAALMAVDFAAGSILPLRERGGGVFRAPGPVRGWIARSTPSRPMISARPKAPRMYGR